MGVCLRESGRIDPWANEGAQEAADQKPLRSLQAHTDRGSANMDAQTVERLVRVGLVDVVAEQDSQRPARAAGARAGGIPSECRSRSHMGRLWKK